MRGDEELNKSSLRCFAIMAQGSLQNAFTQSFTSPKGNIILYINIRRETQPYTLRLFLLQIHNQHFQVFNYKLISLSFDDVRVFIKVVVL